MTDQLFACQGRVPIYAASIENLLYT